DGDLTGGVGSQGVLDVRDADGGAGGRDPAAAAAHADGPVEGLPVVADGNPPLVGPQLVLRLEVAVGQVRGADPQLPVPRLHLDAGEGPQRLRVRAPGDEGGLGGPVVV